MKTTDKPHTSDIALATHVHQNGLDKEWVAKLLARAGLPKRIKAILERHAVYLAQEPHHTLGSTDPLTHNKRRTVRAIEAALDKPKPVKGNKGSKGVACYTNRPYNQRKEKEKGEAGGPFVAPAWLSNPALLPKFPPGDKRNGQ